MNRNLYGMFDFLGRIFEAAFKAGELFFVSLIGLSFIVTGLIIIAWGHWEGLLSILLGASFLALPWIRTKK